jgi:hypothetical protein
LATSANHGNDEDSSLATVRAVSSGASSGALKFVFETVVFALVAHAMGYLAHEYAHSIFAWALGWMKEPFGIDYGHASLNNFIFLDDVDDNVDYAPIMAAGHGVSAAIIALAGAFVGNAAVYFLLYALLRTNVVKSRRRLASFFYWLSLMSAANVWSYVPVRALTTHADIAIAANGFGVSVWLLFPFLIVPSLYIVHHFFCRNFAGVYAIISSGRSSHLSLLIAFTAFWFFYYFVGDSASGSYGLIAQVMSLTSRYLLFPLAVVWLTNRYAKVQPSETQVD